MSYAIIRNKKYKMKNLSGIYRHNERKNTNYSNKDIKRENGINNYSLKKVNTTYEKAFYQLKQENSKLKNYIKRTFEVVKHLFDFPLDSFKRLVNNFVKQFER